MKLVIAGSRSLHGQAVVKLIEAHMHGVTEIVSGGAPGVDYEAAYYATRKRINQRVFPADWNRFGKAAGIHRNIQMAKYADALLAIWDGRSRGTSHIIDFVRMLGKPATVVELRADGSTHITRTQRVGTAA